jgi:hypothetical protein
MFAIIIVIVAISIITTAPTYYLSFYDRDHEACSYQEVD